MDALVSGQAGLAILTRGNEASLIRMDYFDEELACSPSLIPYLLQDTDDTVELKSTSTDAVVRRLQFAGACDRALHLILILLDADEDAETRAMSVESLLELICDPELLAHLKAVLYSAPLPDPSALNEAIGLALRPGGLKDTLTDLRNNQALIANFSSAWKQLPLELFGNSLAKEHFRRRLVARGAFASLVSASHDPKKFSLAVLECHQDLKDFKNHRSILGRWLSQLKPPNVEHSISLAPNDNDALGVLDDDRPSQPLPRRSSYEAYENVKKQKEAIIPSFKRGDFQKVRGYIDQLIESQLRFGDRSYAAMSLCDLAQHAKTVSNHSLQLELAKRAAEIFPDDGWTHGQVADAYFCLGQYDNAAQSFKEAAFFGKASFARAGQARILRGQGKFAEALELYDRSINDFPGEVTLWNGRAEVFREMWKLDEALKAYESTVEKFPLEAVPRCGRAAVLKDLGRLDEALDAYTRTCELFGGDIVPRNGRADVLKEMGRLKDALTAYRETADAFPEDAVSRCGLAEVLRDTGQLEDALRLYTETIAAFPYVSVAYCGCAETLRDMNRLDTALASYDKALTKFPNDEFVRNSRANILKLLGKPEAALQAYDETIRSFPYDIFARSGRADLLKTLGRIPEALEAYDYLIERNPSGQNFWHAKAAILVVLGEYAKAEEMLPSKSPETRDDWIAYHVRGMILLKSNKLDAAVVHFETGLNSIPFARQRKYFQNALAIARLRRGEYAKATETLISAEEPMAEILKIHAFGELRQSDLAKRSLARLELVCPVTLIPLRDELAARYQLRQQPPRHEDPWIFDEECRVALLNAA